MSVTMLSLVLPGDDSSSFCLNQSDVRAFASSGEGGGVLVEDSRSPGTPPGPLLTSTPLVATTASFLPPATEAGAQSDDSGCEEASSTLILQTDDSCCDGPITPSAEEISADQKLHVTTPAINGKTGKLKRVSFGSSKGSMVETLVYDYESVAPLKEEDSSDSSDGRTGLRHSRHSYTPLIPYNKPVDSADQSGSRLRVTYYESNRPLQLPEDVGAAPLPEQLDLPATQLPTPVDPQSDPGHSHVTASLAEMPTTYIVQSVDPGWQNPFRPGGELSVEAEHIVRAIQAGRPLSKGPGEAVEEEEVAPPSPPSPEMRAVQSPVAPPLRSAVNGSSPALPPAEQTDGPAHAQKNGSKVEVQHSLVQPEDATQVQQVTIKKKRGKCCVIQ